MLYRVRPIKWHVNVLPTDMPDDQKMKQMIPVGSGHCHASSKLRINNNIIKETGKVITKLKHNN